MNFRININEKINDNDNKNTYKLNERQTKKRQMKKFSI